MQNTVEVPQLQFIDVVVVVVDIARCCACQARKSRQCGILWRFRSCCP